MKVGGPACWAWGSGLLEDGITMWGSMQRRAHRRLEARGAGPSWLFCDNSVPGKQTRSGRPALIPSESEVPRILSK